MATISFYPNVKETNGSATSIDSFLHDIKNGRWENQIIDYKTGRRTKDSLPCVTISGEFAKRKASDIIKHSGYICIDIDNLEDEEIKKATKKLREDSYVYAIWKSVSQKGLAVLFRIEGRNHLKAFLGISEYLFVNYNLVIDQSCKDISRLRFISYDPELYINEGAVKFTQYIKERKVPQKIPKTIFVKNDFMYILSQITARGIDMVNAYSDWLNIGLAFAHKFGESGREYFHIISSIGHKYNEEICDKKYNSCLKSTRGEVTISTFYWMCRQFGIDTMTEKTKLIAVTASNSKKSGRNVKSTIKILEDVEGIKEIESKDIVQQVFEHNIEIPTDNFLYQLETHIRQNYSIQRNDITKRLEIDGEPMLDENFNTIYIETRKIFNNNNVSFDIVSRLINSNFTPTYNPLIEWIEINKNKISNGNIDKLIKTIITDMDYAFVELFMRKWLIQIIETIHGNPGPLMLILSGSKQNTGKTEWFRRLLPKNLKPFYAESQLDKGKDDEILMTQKLIIMNDEMGGKTKDDITKLKNLTSKDTFSLRLPYGKSNIDLKRLAILAGTSNDDQILNDPTGNRRLIPINVLDINKNLYNSINKTELLVELYWIWKEGKFNSNLSNEQIHYLNEHTQNFNEVSVESELIEKWYSPGGDIFLTNTDIKVFLENVSKQKLSSRKIGLELRRLGYKSISKRNEGRVSKGYMVYELNRYIQNIVDYEPPF